MPLPEFLKTGDFSPEQRIAYLTINRNMGGMYLGDCFEIIRSEWYGNSFFEMTIQDMVSFIQNWMQHNENDFQDLFLQKGVGEHHAGVELPRIDQEVCPRYKWHQGTVRDLGGRVRCSHTEEEKMKPTYLTEIKRYDSYSQTEKISFDDEGPIPSLLDDATEEYEREKPTEIIRDVCYAIMSEKDWVMPLETVIKRLNKIPESVFVYCTTRPGPCMRLDEFDVEKRMYVESRGMCPGHKEPNKKVGFEFSGKKLAKYVQRWWEQTTNEVVPPFLSYK